MLCVHHVHKVQMLDLVMYLVFNKIEKCTRRQTYCRSLLNETIDENRKGSRGGTIRRLRFDSSRILQPWIEVAYSRDATLTSLLRLHVAVLEPLWGPPFTVKRIKLEPLLFLYILFRLFLSYSQIEYSTIKVNKRINPPI